MLGNMWIIPINAKKPEDARSTRYKNNDKKTAKPFLKWAGGKGQLLSEIQKHYQFNDGKITKYAERLIYSANLIFRKFILAI